MQKYIHQLLEDIAVATENVSVTLIKEEPELHDWIADDEEDKIAPVRNLQEWTGILKEMLPPAGMLDDEQLGKLLNALKKMLEAYNWLFVLQNKVPERIQYAAIRDNFNQEAKIKQWHMGFFAICCPGTGQYNCALGQYCECAFYAKFFSGFIHDELSAKEERAGKLKIEISHLKRKYGGEWMKYYPYHLDKNYDDENGNAYDYGFGEEGEDGDDTWWR